MGWLSCRKRGLDFPRVCHKKACRMSRDLSLGPALKVRKVKKVVIRPLGRSRGGQKAIIAALKLFLAGTGPAQMIREASRTPRTFDSNGKVPIEVCCCGKVPANIGIHIRNHVRFPPSTISLSASFTSSSISHWLILAFVMLQNFVARRR